MNNVKQVLEDSINDHQQAIDKAKAKLKELEVTYSVGDRFKVNGVKYLLCSIDFKAHDVVAMNLSMGVRGNPPWTVANNERITQAEFDSISSGDKRRYWDNRKQEEV